MQPAKIHQIGVPGPTAEEQSLLDQTVEFDGNRMTVREAVRRGFLEYDSVRDAFRITAKAKRH